MDRFNDSIVSLQLRLLAMRDAQGNDDDDDLCDDPCGDPRLGCCDLVTGSSSTNVLALELVLVVLMDLTISGLMLSGIANLIALFS